MKFSTSLALAAAPLSLALSIGDPASSWVVRRDHQLENGLGGQGQVIEIDPTNVLGGLKGESKDDSKDDGKGGRKKGNNNNNASGAQVIIIWVNNGNGAATTTVNEKVTVTQTVTAGAGTGAATPPAAAATHTVTVGGPGGLIYQPDQLTNVPIGDTVEFEFLSQNHTVSQSAFEKPCALIEGGMDSGFMPNPNNSVSPPPRMAMQVMVDTPLWFYCKQAGHCGKGMVFSINPTQEKTQAQFQQLAIEQNGDGKATPITDPSATTAAGEANTPTASLVSPPAASDAVTPGQGTIGSDGSCTCIVTCAAGSFPAAAQGIGSFGGMAGALPLNMAGL